MSIRILILILAVAIAAQNTCPHGLAAKTSFLSCKKTSCHAKEQRPAQTDEQSDARKCISSAKQTFVLNIATQDNSFQILPPTQLSPIFDSPRIEEAFPDPVFRPPIA